MILFKYPMIGLNEIKVKKGGKDQESIQSSTTPTFFQYPIFQKKHKMILCQHYVNVGVEVQLIFVTQRQTVVKSK